MVFMGKVVTSKTKIVEGLDSATPVQPVKAEQETSPIKKEAKDQTTKRGRNKN